MSAFWIILFFIFLILKLCQKIKWSWWWVTCPLWGPLALLVLLGVFCAFHDKVAAWNVPVQYYAP